MEADRALYDFRRADTSPTLLILDRMDDPVTPLLLQWTYQAMIHELLGIHDNRVDMRKFVSKTTKVEQQQLVLSAEQVTFITLMNIGAWIYILGKEGEERGAQVWRKGIQHQDLS